MSARADLRALTSIRGIAAWFVVLFHIRYAIAGLPSEWLAVLSKGYLAVDFFFLLSGFVIWMSWGHRFRDRGIAVGPEFLKKRIARIWPLHIVVLGCTIGLALLLAATGRRDDIAYPGHELGLHLLLMQNWGLTDALSWNVPSWSISAELAAYLLFPVLTLAIDWRRVPSWAVLAAVAALVVLLHATMARGGAMTLGSDVARFGLLRCVIEFAAGSAICALWERWHRAPATPALSAGFVALLIALLWAVGMPETLAVPGLFAALLLAIALSAGMRCNPLDNRVLHYLGEISYATYLGHFMLFVVFKLMLVDDAHAVPGGLILLYLLLVLASSVVLYHLVERPAQRWINTLRIGPERRRTSRRAG